MRSQRVYQQAHPSDRILAVLQRNDGKQFDQHLVRRFVQLVGIYPTGNLVKLDNGDIAVVVKPHAPDPYRPRVKVLMRASGQKLERPFDVNLWEAPEGHPQTVRGPVDPADGGHRPVELSLRDPRLQASVFGLGLGAGARYNERAAACRLTVHQGGHARFVRLAFTAAVSAVAVLAVAVTVAQQAPEPLWPLVVRLPAARHRRGLREQDAPRPPRTAG